MLTIASQLQINTIQYSSKVQTTCSLKAVEMKSLAKPAFKANSRLLTGSRYIHYIWLDMWLVKLSTGTRNIFDQKYLTVF